jgi:hypothetical protein
MDVLTDFGSTARPSLTSPPRSARFDRAAHARHIDGVPSDSGEEVGAQNVTT